MRRPGEARSDYYASVLNKRGAKALAQLKANVREQWSLHSLPPDGSGSDTQASLF